MAEKDGGRYHYEPFQPLTSKQQNNGTNTLKTCDPPNTLKIAGIKENCEKSNRRCCCMGPKATSFWFSLLTNLGICTLLVGYTLLGSFLFLTIEGGTYSLQQRTLASTNRHRTISSATSSNNGTISNTAATAALEARQKTVENIWDITVSLNILYRENWTR